MPKNIFHIPRRVGSLVHSVSSAQAGEKPSGGALQLFVVDNQTNGHTKRVWVKVSTVSAAAAATQNIVHLVTEFVYISKFGSLFIVYIVKKTEIGFS